MEIFGRMDRSHNSRVKEKLELMLLIALFHLGVAGNVHQGM